MFDSLRRGVGAGAVAGIAYGVLTAFVINPLVEHAEHSGHDHGHGAEPVVSEATTAAAGVGGGVLWGLLLGAAFGVAYYLLEPSLPGAGAAKAYALAAAGFLTVSGVPWLVLPPVAPGAEHALDAGARVVVYGGAMLAGAAACALSVVAYRRVRDGRSRAAAAAAGATPFVACALAAVALPTGTAGGPPAALATAFRWLVVFGQVGLWALLAATFERLRRRADPAGRTLEEFDDDRAPAGA